jgi:hypothetical protein
MVDQSAVGRGFTPVTARVEPGRLRYFFKTLGELNPVYCDAQAARHAGHGVSRPGADRRHRARPHSFVLDPLCFDHAAWRA